LCGTRGRIHPPGPQASQSESISPSPANPEQRNGEPEDRADQRENVGSPGQLMLATRVNALALPRYMEGDLWVARFRDPACNIIGVWQQIPSSAAPDSECMSRSIRLSPAPGGKIAKRMPGLGRSADRCARCPGPAAPPPVPRSLATRTRGDRGAGATASCRDRSARRQPPRGRVGNGHVRWPAARDRMMNPPAGPASITT
jgi:hypothetical protein